MRLERITWPEFGEGEPVSPWMSAATYEARVAGLREWLEQQGLTHLVVYGDREHFGHLLWLAGLDPRFEEAFVVLGRTGRPLLAVGNECAGYAPASPAVRAGVVETRVTPELSLPDQPALGQATIAGVLREAGIDAHSRVGVAGWKTAPSGPAVPGMLLDPLRFAAGWENVTDASAEMLRRRAACTAEEIAYFEWTNTVASEGMKRVLRAVRPGARDFELLAEARYAGLPLGCAMTLKCGANTHSLASARGERVERGGRFSCGICYWGANVCRAGWAVESARELPEEARDYLDAFVFPYFAAMGEWFGALRTGGVGGALHDAIARRFGPVKLNAGHLIHYEEWLSSPVYEGSAETLRSGMVMQSDVIPSHPAYYSTRMEDGYALADEALRAELREKHPEMMRRCEARGEFLRARLGLPLSEDVLPLSNLAGMIAPFVLAPESVVVAG